MIKRFSLIIAITLTLLFGGCIQTDTPAEDDVKVAPDPTKLEDLETIPPEVNLEEKEEELKEIIETTIRREKVVSLSTSVSKGEEEKVISIFIDNPLQKDVISVRTWLSYNPQEIEIIEIDSSDSGFDLAAPGENEVNEVLGLVKIGKSKTGLPLSEKSILVSKVKIKQKLDGVSIMDFYDYQEGEEGHTQVNIKLDEEAYPVNLLKQPVSPSIVIQ